MPSRMVFLQLELSMSAELASAELVKIMQQQLMYTSYAPSLQQ